jgi:hypothetical protein
MTASRLVDEMPQMKRGEAQLRKGVRALEEATKEHDEE